MIHHNDVLMHIRHMHHGSPLLKDFLHIISDSGWSFKEGTMIQYVLCTCYSVFGTDYFVPILSHPTGWESSQSVFSVCVLGKRDMAVNPCCLQAHRGGA